MRNAEWLFAVVTVASAAGCTISSSGGSAGSIGTGGSGTGGNTGTAGSVLCPAAPPTSGEACQPPSYAAFGDAAHCTWGEDPRPQCRTKALCQDDKTWHVSPPSDTCSTPALPADCPSPSPTSGTVCSDKTLSCWYADGTFCNCSDCEGGSQYPICTMIDPPEWACGHLVAGCPDKIPQAGAACSTPDLDCGPSCELYVFCKDGAWVWESGQCPICASPSTPIATPDGERPIADLRAGDRVYSVEGEAIVAVPILRSASTQVTRHHVMRVVLDSGAVLEISPGHPTADGRTFADLRAGGTIDGRQRIVAVDEVPYAHDRTYDILPDSNTGYYFAAGAEIGSTLLPAAQGRAARRDPR